MPTLSQAHNGSDLPVYRTNASKSHLTLIFRRPGVSPYRHSWRAVELHPSQSQSWSVLCPAQSSVRQAMRHRIVGLSAFDPLASFDCSKCSGASVYRIHPSESDSLILLLGQYSDRSSVCFPHANLMCILGSAHLPSRTPPRRLRCTDWAMSVVTPDNRDAQDSLTPVFVSPPCAIGLKPTGEEYAKVI